MKGAVCLFGQYSKWYKYNEYKGYDLFSFTFEKNKDESAFKISKYVTEPLEMVSFYDKETYETKYFINKLNEIITEYQLQNNIKYDTVIYCDFQDILFDREINNGVFISSKYFDILNVYTRLNSFNLVSDNCIYYNKKIMWLWELNLEERKMIFDALFKNVIEFEEYKKQDSVEQKETLFIIPSVIYTSNLPLNYASTRSVYSPQERLKQTYEQLISLSKLRNKNSKVYLCEGSRLTFRELKKLHKHADKIILFSTEEGYDYANFKLNKNIYELHVMRNMINMNTNADWIFKFGGRYHINHFFNIENYKQKKPVFKFIEGKLTWKYNSIFECIIYSIPKLYFNKYFDIYTKALNESLNSDAAVEDLMLKYTENQYKNIDNLGVIGHGAVFGNTNFC